MYLFIGYLFPSQAYKLMRTVTSNISIVSLRPRRASGSQNNYHSWEKEKIDKWMGEFGEYDSNSVKYLQSLP